MATSVREHTGLLAKRGRSMTELYPRILQTVLDEGERVAPRGRPTLELSPFVFELEDPRQSLVLQKQRRLNRTYATVEKLALIAGIADPAMFCFYVNGLSEFVNPDTGEFDGCYGPRVTSQLPYVLKLLRRDPDSRRAVIALYGTGDQHESLDVPCTTSLQFLIRGGQLSLIVNMRSSDVYLGLPYDVHQFCFLQQVMAHWLGVDLGHYMHVAGSAHLYESDRDAVARVIDTADELLVGPVEPDFDIPFEQTPLALHAFFSLEQAVRTSTLGPCGFGHIHDCLRPSAESIARFCRRKLSGR